MRWSVKIPCLVVAALCRPAAAQDPAPPPVAVWTLRAGPDSLGAVAGATAEAAARVALDDLSRAGFPLARVDSAGEGAPRGATLYVSPGPAATVGRLDVVGAVALAAEAVTTGWSTREGRPYRPDALEADLARALDRYAAAGYVDARLTPRVVLRSAAAGRADSPPSVVADVTVDVVEGPAGVVAGVELVGARRASRTFASRVTGVAPGARLATVDPEAVRRSLEATGLYARVGTPERVLDADGRVVLRVPVEEAAPGAFDGVLGFLPASGGARAQVVGSGRVELRNLFGVGRTARVALDRTPGLGSSVQVAASDPFVLGLPVRLAGLFDGLSRDSTFSRQTARIEAGTRVAGGLDVTVTASREAVTPGRFGAGLVGGLPRVRRSTAVFFGAGLRFRRLDAVYAPRRGLALDVSVESGRRRRSAGADSLAAQAERQQRLVATGRLYVPTFGRQSVVVGLDARVLVGGLAAGGDQAAAPDEGELFRIGGAQTLRGYDEDALVGTAVGRLFGEARLHVDAESFGFAFFDLGYTVRPDLPGRAGSRRTRPGYGAGAQLRTGLGLVTLTYALNPALALGRGRIHVGLGFGL